MNLDDFDRSLAEFLADGPSRAPEAPVIAAMAHARTTPRRPDPLRAFRADPMAPRGTGGFAVRSGLVLATVALAVGAVGVAVVGSRPPQDSVLTPPSASPSPISSATPDPTPPIGSHTVGGPDTPLGSPAVPPIHVALQTQGGNPASVDVVDESGKLTGAVSGTVPDSVANDSFDAFNDDPTTVRLTWAGSPCDTVHRLTLDPALTTLTIDRPLCFGDSIAAYRSLILTFADPVDAAALNTVLFAGRGGVDMPTWTASAPDSESDRYDITLDDPGHVVESLEGSFDPQVASAGAGPSGIRVVASTPTSLTLIWLGPACATTPALSIDPSGATWRVANAPCDSSKPDVVRMVGVTLKTALPGDAVPTVELVAAAP